VDLVHEAERISGRKLEKCEQVTDDMAVKLLGPVAKASRLTKMKLMDIGFEELVRKHRERKRRERRIREKAERRARKASEK
jgi:ATP-dependent RNA helicase DDX49/DBP8